MRPTTTRVAVTCWCERHVVYIDAVAVGDTTASCGHWQCVPPTVAPTPPPARGPRYTR